MLCTTAINTSSTIRTQTVMATVICSLGHGLRLTAVPRSTPPCIASMSLDRVPDSAGGKGGNVTVRSHMACEFP